MSPASARSDHRRQARRPLTKALQRGYVRHTLVREDRRYLRLFTDPDSPASIYAPDNELNRQDTRPHGTHRRSAARCATVRPAAAATPCWKALLNDWYDGRIDNTYALHCYTDALKHLPADVQTYSSAHDDIQRALQSAIAKLGKTAQGEAEHEDRAAAGRHETTATTTTPTGRGAPRRPPGGGRRQRRRRPQARRAASPRSRTSWTRPARRRCRYRCSCSAAGAAAGRGGRRRARRQALPGARARRRRRLQRPRRADSGPSIPAP